jgi:hypothetical protein
MSHGRSNNLMICNIHADIVKSLDLVKIANTFVADVDNRLNVFGNFIPDNFA